MTIPEDASIDREGRPARVTRPEPARTGPRRSRPSPASSESETPTISEDVAYAVRRGYDVIAENIEQGRQAASAFRLGAYNFREVPADLEKTGLRMLRLARELTITTFDICERMLTEMGPLTSGSSRDLTEALPAFRPTVARPTKKPSDPLPLSVVVEGREALSRTATLERPRIPVRPEDIRADPLQSRSSNAEPIREVRFDADLQGGGLIATVNAPHQPPGFYSGLVYAGDDPVPLGSLTIEIQA